LARSILSRKACWSQVLRWKEWISSWVMIISKEMCLFLIKAAWKWSIKLGRCILSLSWWFEWLACMRVSLAWVTGIFMHLTFAITRVIKKSDHPRSV
jgi:hypothetical protein